MALRLPDFGDPSQTREMAEREHLRDHDRVRTSAMIWLAVIAIVLVLALVVRAAF